MKFTFFFFVFIVIAFISIQCHPGENISSIIAEIEDHYVPDKREGIFSIAADRSGSNLVLRGETDHPEAHGALISTLENEGYQIADSIIDLPLKKDSCWGLISLSVASFRTQPSHKAEMSTQALMGTPVKILKESGGWRLVQTPDKYIGWCERGAISERTAAELDKWRQSERVLITPMHGVVRDPISDRTISDVVSGCIVQKTGTIDEAIAVRLPDGRKGIVSSSHIADFNVWRRDMVLQAEQLIGTAESFLGLPYQWGDTSAKAVDCSGYIKTIYFLNGYVVARDASQQARYGMDVPLENGWKEFNPGDLLFFGSNEGRQGITHVGMYIGDSEFIHSSGRVKINSLDSSRINFSYSSAASLQNVRRIIGNTNYTGITRISDHSWY